MSRAFGHYDDHDIDPDWIKDLQAERDALRECLERLVENWDHPSWTIGFQKALDSARALLNTTPEEYRMSDTCPTCGQAVSVHDGSEGTNHYVKQAEAEPDALALELLRRVDRERAMMVRRWPSAGDSRVPHRARET